VRSHTASAKRRGLTDDEIAAIGDEQRWPGTFKPEEIVLLELATQLCHDSHDIPPALIERLHQYWSDAELAEILMVAGQANMNNRVGSAARQIFPARRSPSAP
jgi:alkylhydroperoxidase family enzyme